MTMARDDRLFGVTMAERGVSQLVSVDYAAAEKLRETVSMKGWRIPAPAPCPSTSKASGALGIRRIAETTESGVICT